MKWECTMPPSRRSPEGWRIDRHHQPLFQDKNGLLEATMRDITGRCAGGVEPPARPARRRPAGTPARHRGGQLRRQPDKQRGDEGLARLWASSMHQPMLYRLQQVSSRRLLSNIV
jgi:TetR/AcrR family transcriptional repressor of bet genes